MKLPGRIPLRIKLISAVLALVAVALAVISVAGISYLRSYLLNQTDSQLQGYDAFATHQVQEYLLGQPQQESYHATVEWIPPHGKPRQVVIGANYGNGAQPLPAPDGSVLAGGARRSSGCRAGTVRQRPLARHG